MRIHREWRCTGSTLSMRIGVELLPCRCCSKSRSISTSASGGSCVLGPTLQFRQPRERPTDRPWDCSRDEDRKRSISPSLPTPALWRRRQLKFKPFFLPDDDGEFRLSRDLAPSSSAAFRPTFGLGSRQCLHCPEPPRRHQTPARAAHVKDGDSPLVTN